MERTVEKWVTLDLGDDIKCEVKVKVLYNFANVDLPYAALDKLVDRIKEVKKESSL